MSISEPFVSYCHKGLYKVDGGIGSTDSEILNTYTAKKMDVSGCTVIIVIMPTPNFYRKYAPPFPEGSFLKILWLEMPG